MAERAPRAAVLSVSSSRAEGSGADDVAGDELVRFAEALGAEVAARDVVPDVRGVIQDRICHYCDEVGCDLVLTTGGTGFAPDDVTPVTTEAYYAGQEGLSPRPLRSVMDLSKIEATGFEPEDATAALERYLS